MATYITANDVIANNVLSSPYLNRILYNLEVLSHHDHSGSAGEGSNIVPSASSATTSVARVYLFPAGRPNTNLALEMFSSSAPTGQLPDITSSSEMVGAVVWGFQNTRPTQIHDWYGWQMPIRRGIYQLKVFYLPAPNGGAASIELGTSGLGLIDTYSTASGSTLIKTFDDIHISTSASYLLRVIQTSSNSLSSSNVTRLGGMTMVRVAFW